MNSFSRKLLVPIIVLVSLSLTAVLFAPAISAVHAAGSPAITIQPSTQGAKPVNSLVLMLNVSTAHHQARSILVLVTMGLVLLMTRSHPADSQEARFYSSQ